MWNKNALTEKLRIQYPIIQGPFGGGFSTAELTAAVSNLGGLGSFGAQPLSPQAIKDKIAEIKSLTTNPFAMNLWVSNEDPEIASLNEERFSKMAGHYKNYFDQMGIQAPSFPKRFAENFEEQVEALLEAKPPAFSFVFGIPDPSILDRCRKLGIVTIGAATTLKEALAIEAAGVDCILASGFEAGGHRPSFLKSAEDSLMGTGTLISQVTTHVRIPVIAAGGISTARDIAALAKLGAQGFQLGTAFLACKESGASDFHRAAIFNKESTTTLSRHYSGRLARFIENDFIRETKTLPHLPYPAQNYMLGELKKVATTKERLDLAPMYSGQGAPLLTHRTAKDLMEALVREIPDQLERRTST